MPTTAIHRVILAPGHGLSNASPGVYDPGASSPYGEEAQIVSDITDAVLDDYWGNEDAEIAVIRVPQCSDACLSMHRRSTHLTETIRHINEFTSAPFDLVVSIHMNAADSGNATGTEVLYASERTKGLAALVSATVAAYLDLRDRGAKHVSQAHRSRVAILQDTRPRAILIELGFVTCERDVAQIVRHGTEAVKAAIEAVRKASQ